MDAHFLLLVYANFIHYILAGVATGNLRACPIFATRGGSACTYSGLLVLKCSCNVSFVGIAR